MRKTVGITPEPILQFLRQNFLFSSELVHRKQMSTPQFRFKVVVLGEGCVGKTSLILRYTKNEFTDTVRLNNLTKSIDFFEN